MKLVETVYGVDGEHKTAYLTRVTVGHLRVHIFHRGDADPDAHDHPWSFWTFPLVSYWEEVFDPKSRRSSYRHVRCWRWHHRPADFAHRVLGPAAFEPGDWAFDPSLPYLRKGKIVTIVWRGAGGRNWGFWKSRDGATCWVPWRKYVFEGGKRAPCEPAGADVAGSVAP